MREQLAAGSDPNEVDKLERTPLHLCCWAGHAELVAVLAEHRLTDINAKAKDDFTPLHFAATAKKEAAKVVQLLASAAGKKLDLNARIRKGRKTALHIAAAKGSTEVCRALLAAGAEIAAKTSLKQTPLDLADVNNGVLVELLTPSFLRKDGEGGKTAKRTAPAAAPEAAPEAAPAPAMATAPEVKAAVVEHKAEGQPKKKPRKDKVKLAFDHLC